MSSGLRGPTVSVFEDRERLAAEAEMIWATGLFEGEGCISLRKKSTGKHLLVLAVVSTDRDVLERFWAAVGGIGTLIPRRKCAAHHKDQWLWKVSGKRALEIASNPVFAQNLGKRRSARLKEVVAGTDHGLPDLRLGNKAHITSCPAGHSYDEANTCTWHGMRYCRACDGQRARERRRKARERRLG